MSHRAPRTPQPAIPEAAHLPDRSPDHPPDERPDRQAIARADRDGADLPELVPRRWLAVGTVLLAAGGLVNCASLNVERGLYEGLQTQQRQQSREWPPAAPAGQRSDYERYERERAALQGQRASTDGQGAAASAAAGSSAASSASRGASR